VTIIAFFSYARHDDKSANGLLSKIRQRLEIEIQAHAGDDELEVFQDMLDLAPGDVWREKLREAIDSSAFFIPIVTPFYFKRPACRRELEIWLSNYKSQDERRRIIPILFLPLPEAAIDKKTGRPEDRLREQIDALQSLDFTGFRNNRGYRGTLGREISKLAQLIVRRM
jgi:hypothetical protein